MNKQLQEAQEWENRWINIHKTKGEFFEMDKGYLIEEAKSNAGKLGCGFRLSPMNNMCGVAGLLCSECQRIREIYERNLE